MVSCRVDDAMAKEARFRASKRVCGGSQGNERKYSVDNNCYSGKGTGGPGLLEGGASSVAVGIIATKFAKAPEGGCGGSSTGIKG